MPNFCLWVCWFFGKNLSNFVLTSWKPDKPYYHILHLEHLILALLSDGRKDKRKKGKQLIMDARACEHEIVGVRSMYKTYRTQMNFAARDYSTFIKGLFIHNFRKSVISCRSSLLVWPHF